jgi:hypothetical protein
MKKDELLQQQKTTHQQSEISLKKSRQAIIGD